MSQEEQMRDAAEAVSGEMALAEELDAVRRTAATEPEAAPAPAPRIGEAHRKAIATAIELTEGRYRAAGSPVGDYREEMGERLREVLAAAELADALRAQAFEVGRLGLPEEPPITVHMTVTPPPAMPVEDVVKAIADQARRNVGYHRRRERENMIVLPEGAATEDMPFVHERRRDDAESAAE